MNTKEVKKQALSIYLECGTEDLKESKYDSNTFEYGNQEYLILTDDEADEEVKIKIEQSVWAFNSSFLEKMTEVPKEMFEACQDKCEDANEPFLMLINKTCGIDSFVGEAIRYDGRGQFISHYDGHENEQDFENITYYIYRTN